MACWSMLNEYLLLEVFSYLPIKDLSQAGQVCKYWNFVSNDDWLWKRQFHVQFKEAQNPTLPPFAKSWRSEMKRLLWSIPTFQTQPEPLKNPHCDEITHVTFSKDGNYMATCGRDSLIILWSAHSFKVVDTEDLRAYGWQTAQFCEFNHESSMLMVSGLLTGDISGSNKGEIMVFTLKAGRLRICSRMANKPWDAYGCWYGNKYVISAEFKWLAHMVSNTMLLLNKVSFALEQSLNDHTLAGIRTLFRIYNNSGNAVRHLCVANVPKDLGEANPENLSGLKLLESIDKLIKLKVMENESQALVNLSLDRNDEDLIDSFPDIDNHYINLIPNGKFEFYEDIFDNSEPFTMNKCYYETRKLAFDMGYEENDWVFDDFSDEDLFEDDEDVEWEYYDDNDEDLQNPDFLKIDEGKLVFKL